MDDALLLKYAAKAPRYTSYPTAAQFSAEVDAVIYGEWLRRTPRDASLSLYAHIPFCSSMCWYCGCQATVVNTIEPVVAYLSSLRAEIDRVADRLGERRRVTHMHWGGGTPTLLPGPEFLRLMADLGERFAIADDAEIAVEIDPRTIDRELAQSLADGGVNRVSLGIQDFDPIVQAAVNRVQPHDVVAGAIDALRAAGIDRISADLLYGLPHQTPATVARAVEATAALGADRVSLFGYAHVPWMRPHQKLIPDEALPGPEARLAMFRSAAAALADSGFVAIGLDHFARPSDPLAVAANAGMLRRNFQGYTVDTADALIGFGASAISTLPQGYAQNAPTVPAYRAAMVAGDLATVRGVALSDDDRLRRTVIERLMCDFHVDLDKVAASFATGREDFADAMLALAPLAADGLVAVNAGRVEIPPEARIAVRSICAAFDRYLAPGGARHSPAI